MTRKQGSAQLSQEAIDDLVTAQADDESAWDEPVRSKGPKWRTIRVPQDLVARAAVVATLLHEPRIDDWIRRIIRERIELEEVELPKGTSRRHDEPDAGPGRGVSPHPAGR